MKVLITGATGFVGKRLVKRLLHDGHQVVATSRNREKAQKTLGGQVEVFPWKAPHGDFPQEALNGVDTIINLMGENLASKRWSDSQKLKLRESRILGTQKLVHALALNKSTVKIFISTSAIGYYEVNTEAALNEEDAPGNNFLAALCLDWEKATEGLDSSIRKVIFRVGVVLGKEGGALQKLYPLFKLGLGGPVGLGKQMMSWIHVEDLVTLYATAITDSSFVGVYNGVAPTPVSNKDFTKALAKAVKRPALFPAPPLALKVAMGEMSTIVLDSQIIDCKNLKEKNHTFAFPTIDQALEDLCR